MRAASRPDIPLAVVACDFRSAPTALREWLVSTRESRQSLFEAIRRIDPCAGFMTLETCNRVEWIISTEQPSWLAQMLKARMVSLWEQALLPPDVFPTPVVFMGEAAAARLLRVAVGMESLALGEAQIAGQLQAALKSAQEGNTASVILNRLGSAAGRLARTASRLGFRSNHKQGIHGLVAQYLEARLGGPDTKTILVAGMGKIGRKTAAVVFFLEQVGGQERRRRQRDPEQDPEQDKGEA